MFTITYHTIGRLLAYRNLFCKHLRIFLRLYKTIIYHKSLVSITKKKKNKKNSEKQQGINMYVFSLKIIFHS